MTVQTSFPFFTLTTLPTGTAFQELSDVHATDPFETKYRVSFWQYARALLELEAAKAITPREKEAIRCLFETSNPLCSDDLKNAMGEKSPIVAHGKHGLGGFGGKLIGKLNSLFSLNIPSNMKDDPDTKGEGLLSIFITFIHYPNVGGQLWFNLRPDFRAALARCFDMTTW